MSSKALTAIILFLSLVITATPQHASANTPTTSDILSHSRVAFERNVGQSDPRVEYIGRSPTMTLLVDRDGFVLIPATPIAAGRTPQSDRSISLRFLNPHPDRQVTPGTQLASRSNYFIGNKPERWRTDIENFSDITVHDVWPGIDLVLYGRGTTLEFDFRVSPGADPKHIQFQYVGAQGISLPDSRTVEIATAAGTVIQHLPTVYEERSDGTRREVDTRYALDAAGVIAFELADYDRHATLVIDPTLDYSSYFGGSQYEDVVALAIGSDGSIYFAGTTGSPDYPTASPYDGTLATATDMLVTKLSADGRTTIYSTYLGSESPYEVAFGIAVDSAGSAYISGSSNGATFPITPGAFQSTLGGGAVGGPVDATVVKLNPAGNAVDYATFLGGSGVDYAYQITVDSAGSAYVAVAVGSSDYPTVNPIQAARGQFDWGITKLAPDGRSAVYSTYFGTPDYEEPVTIAVNQTGEAYVAGFTKSAQWPTANAIQPTFGGGSQDAALIKLNATGSAVLFSTYLGGSGMEYSVQPSLQIGACDGSVYLAGVTDSANFPTKNALRPTIGGGQDAFLVRLTADGQSFIYSTYFGGSGSDSAGALALTPSGVPLLIGTTNSPNFPVQSPLQASLGGGTDTYVSVFSIDGSALHFSTYLGGLLDDHSGSAAWGVNNGKAIIVGATNSSNWPTVSPMQPARAGGQDGYIAIVSGINAVPPVPEFEPPVNGSSTTNRTPTISGTAQPLSTLTLTDNGSTVQIISVPCSGQWSFTPSSPLALGTHTFTAAAANEFGSGPPASLTITVLGPSTFTLSGTVTLNGSGLNGVSVNGGSSLGSTTTDVSGNYSFANVPANTAYDLTLTKPGHTFQVVAPGQSSGVVTGNTTVNFTASVSPPPPPPPPQTFTLSGTVTLGGGGLAGVTVNGGAVLGSTATNSSGGFLFGGIPLDTPYSLTLSRAGHTFQVVAPGQVAGIISGNTVVDFTATATGPGPFTAIAIVTLANLDRDPLPNILVELLGSGGSVVASGNTDTTGAASFPGTPDGNYDLRVTSPDFTIKPDLRASSAPISASNPIREYRAVPQTRNPVFTVWNGFLEMTNILELVNTGSRTLTADVTCFDILGAALHSEQVDIAPFSQRDRVVNDYKCFRTESYGILRVQFSEEHFDGRLSFYRQDPKKENYEFAFSMPFVSPARGTSYLLFNTNQPSLDPGQANAPVPNWCQVANLSTARGAGFTVTLYDLSGSIAHRQQFTVPPFGRRDVQCGHEIPGGGHVGTVELVPDDPSLPYLAQLFRYGWFPQKNGVRDIYDWAFPLIASAASGRAQQVPISTFLNAANWIELSNVRDLPTQVDLTVFDGSGRNLANQVLTLPPRSQQHYFINAVLPTDNTGTVRLQPRSSDSLVAQSLFYLRNQTTGRVLGMYGSQAIESFGTERCGSYNLFLNQYNWLKVMNNTNRDVTATLAVNGEQGNLSTRAIVIPAFGDRQLGLHEFSEYRTAANTYGTFCITADLEGSLSAELLRLRVDQTGLLDFAAPTRVR